MSSCSPKTPLELDLDLSSLPPLPQGPDDYNEGSKQSGICIKTRYCSEMDSSVFASVRLLLSARRSSSGFALSEKGGGGGGRQRRSSGGGGGGKKGKSRKTLRYLKPGALAQLRDAQKSSSRCSIPSPTSNRNGDGVGNGISHSNINSNGRADIGNLQSERSDPANTVMTPGPSLRVFGPVCPQRKKLLAPKNPLQSPIPFPSPPSHPQTSPNTPSPVAPVAEPSSPESLIESLPLEILVRIVCSLHHDQLEPAFHVCRKFRQAVMIARQCHFDYTTPNRERQEVLQFYMPRNEESWPFARQETNMPGSTVRPQTPKAPRQAPRPLHTRIPLAEVRHLAAPLFQTSSRRRGRNRMKAGGVRNRGASRGAASLRVLFYEEELCQAVAQNSI